MITQNETRPLGAAGLGWNLSLRCERDSPEIIQGRTTNQPQNRMRLQFMAMRLHALGPKPLFHFPDEVERGANLRDHLEEYSRLPADYIKAYGGDVFLLPVIPVPWVEP